MKKTYSIFLFLCLMFAGIGLLSCSSDDDGDEGNMGNEKPTLYIDGIAYYTRHASSHDDFGVFDREGSGHLYSTINAWENPWSVSGVWAVTILLDGYSNVLDLHEGQTLDADHWTVRDFSRWPGVVDSPIYCWDSISGSVTIVSITENEIILKFNKFVVHYSDKNVTHTIDGTVGLTLDPEHLN